MVFTDIETCSHPSHQGVTSSSQGKWVQKAVCSPVSSRPHLGPVTVLSVHGTWCSMCCLGMKY